MVMLSVILTDSFTLTEYLVHHPLEDIIAHMQVQMEDVQNVLKVVSKDDS